MINLESEFSPRVNPADANYPFGSIKDNSSPGANDGTPLAAVWGNDWEGFAQAAMTEAGITPSGVPDTAQDSQLLDAVKAVTSGALRPSVIEALRRSYAEAGYNLVDGSFEAGGTLVNANDVLLYEADGKAYSWGGTLPKTVPAGSTPESTGGIGEGAWVDRTDITLRDDINIVVKRFSSVADMVADSSLYVGQIVETISYHDGWAATGGSIARGGNRYEVTAPGTGVIDGGEFIQLNNGLQSRALFNSSIVTPWDYGAKGDGATLDTVCLQSMFNSDYDCHVDGPDGTVFLVDTTPTNPFALTCVKSKKITGNGIAKIKLKDFSTFWSLNTFTTTRLFVVKSSDTTVDGVVFDANTNNHWFAYNGYRYWEKPLSDEIFPPDAVAILSDKTDAVVRNSHIFNCKILNPRGGISFVGGFNGSTNWEFDADIVRNCKSDFGMIIDCTAVSNTIISPRSNGVIFINGVWACHAHDNTIVNPMYHAMRMYVSVYNSTFHHNTVITDWAEIEASYNDTDNGYFRTSDVSASQYKIFRTGISIGHGNYSNSGLTNEGNIRGCYVFKNILFYKNYTSNTLSSLVSNAESVAALSNFALNNIDIMDNDVHVPPRVGIWVKQTTKTPNGVRVKGNKFRACQYISMLIESNNNDFCENSIIEPLFNGQHIRATNASNNNIIRNTKFKKSASYLDGTLVYVASGSTLWLENQEFDDIYHTVSVESGANCYGNSAPPTNLTPINGWFNSDPTNAPLRFVVSSFGDVEINGVLNGSLATSDNFITSLPSFITPMVAVQFPAWTIGVTSGGVLGTVFAGRVAFSTGRIERRGLDTAIVAFSMSYKTRKYMGVNT